MTGEFSVLMSIYAGEDPANLETSLNSLREQTCLPAEIVLIKDGPLTAALEQVIASFSANDQSIKVYTQAQSHGLGAALRFGLPLCSHELVARMDSDDISLPDRFARQLQFMTAHPEVAVCGSHIEEFLQTPGDLGKIKRVKTGFSRIKRFARLRNPMNHPTVMFRKQAVLQAGSYKDMPLFEDYYLWLRLLKNGYRFENLDEKLLYFRKGQMVRKRHGREYFRKELEFFRIIKKEKLISTASFWLMMATRLPLRILPMQLLGFLYNRMLRHSQGSSAKRL